MKKKPVKNFDKTTVRLALALVIVILAGAYILLKPAEKQTAVNTTTIPGTGISPRLENLDSTTRATYIREPAVAGQFYPDDRQHLETMIETYIQQANASKPSGRIRGMVSPHAGYVYSGLTAAYGYKELEGERYSTVIILGPSHHVYFKGAALDNASDYKTPLGLVTLSDKNGLIAREDGFIVSRQVHAPEHSIEVQIPFLQRVLKGNFAIIPVVTGDVDPETLASTLLKYIDDDTLVIASSDLSHYYTYERAKSLDANCVKSIPTLDYTGMEKCEACGKTPVLTLMWIAKKLGWSGMLLDYRNSGDTAGDKNRVVGYGSIVFQENNSQFTDEEQRILLSMARKTVESYLKDGTIPEVEAASLPSSLLEEKGCFVTLNKNNQLRGCIGHIMPQEPLYRCVIDNAVNAAVHDPRFRPVKNDELGDISMEISVLTVPKKLEYDSPDDLLAKLVPLRDGVVLKSGIHQSTYLPQVWEQIPDKTEFLESLCEKGGSNADCWRSPDAEVYVYRAIVFSE
jgi:hypothetical protein